MAWGRRKAAADGDGSEVEAVEVQIRDADGRPATRRVVGVLRAAAAEEASGAPDEIEAEFGASIPADVKDEIRQLDRPAFKEEDSSLDPIDDLEEYYKHDLSLPPDVYDRLQQAAAAEIGELNSLRAPLDPEVAARVQQRQGLVQNRDPRDIKALKLKAYYRGMQQLRAAEAEAEQQDRAAYLAAKGVPLDVVPQQLVDQTPAEFVAAAQQRLEQRAEAAAARRAAGRRANWLDPTEPESSSEWVEGWDAATWQDAPSTRRALAAAFSAVLGAPVTDASAAAAPRGVDDGWGAIEAAVMRRLAEEPSSSGRSSGGGAKQRSGVTVLTPAQQERNRRRSKAQAVRRERAQAFWISLVAAVGASGLRWLWQQRKKGQGTPRRSSVLGAGPSMQQPQQPLGLL